MNDEAGKYESGISEDAGCYAEDDRAGSRTTVTEKDRKIHRPPSDDRCAGSNSGTGNHRICRCFISNEE